MIVHSGYPEIYLPLLEKIDSACKEFIVEDLENEKIEKLILQYKWKLDDTDQNNIQEKEVETDAKSETKSDAGEVKKITVTKIVNKFKYKGLGMTLFLLLI